MYAVEKTNKEMVRALLARDVNVNCCLEDTQESALHIAVRKYKKKGDNSAIMSIIEMLLEKKINANGRTKSNKSVLDVCPDEEWRRTIEKMLKGQGDE